MTIDIFLIPVINNESKRIFSEARRTISWERAQMGTENFEKIKYLKYWKRNGISDEMLRIIN
jgi:hypothetical protein